MFFPRSLTVCTVRFCCRYRTDEVGIMNCPVPVRQKHEYIFVCILISVYASPNYRADNSGGHGRTEFIIFVSGDTGRLMNATPLLPIGRRKSRLRVSTRDVFAEKRKKKSPQVYGKITVLSYRVHTLYRNDLLTDKHRNPRTAALKK